LKAGVLAGLGVSFLNRDSIKNFFQELGNQESLEDNSEKNYPPGTRSYNYSTLYSQSYLLEARENSKNTTVFFYHKQTGEILSTKKAEDTITISCWRENNGQWNINQEWYDYHRVMIAEERDIPEKDIKITHSIHALRNTNSNSNKKTLASTVIHNGQQKVQGTNMNKIEYAQHKYSTTQLKHLHKHIQNLLADVSYGKAGLESSFNEKTLSSATALGEWQLTPIALLDMEVPGVEPNGNRGAIITDKELLMKTIQDYKEMTALSLQYYETSYIRIQKATKDSLNKITQKYFNGETEKMEKYFLFPFLINAYNGGAKGISTVINRFAEYSKSELEKQFGTYPHGNGFDLYWHASQLAKINKNKH